MPQGILTTFYSRDLICVSFQKVQPDEEKKKPKKKNQKKKKEGGRKTATRPATETLFSPQLFLYEAGAGECGKEDGFLFRNFPMGRERKCELWKWMHFYSFNTECQLPCNLSKSGGRRKRSEG